MYYIIFFILYYIYCFIFFYIFYIIYLLYLYYIPFKNSKKLVLIIYLFILENSFFNIVDKVWIKDTLGDDNLFKFFIFWNDKLLIILTIYLWQSIFRFDFLEKRTWKKKLFFNHSYYYQSSFRLFQKTLSTYFQHG